LQIWTGVKHAVAVADDLVYVWGEFVYEDKERVVPVPMQLDFKLKVADVACGFDHTLVLTHNHQVYGMGKNTFGQLGLAKSVVSVSSFTLLDVRICKYDNYKPLRIFAGLRQSWVVTYCDRGSLGNEFIFATGKTKEINFIY
jgi:alpha-tubulin suppressor-like RCC1 family protein